MDIRLSNDDRVGNQPTKRRASAATGTKARKGERIEPRLDDRSELSIDSEDRPRSKARRAKAQPAARTKKKRRGGGFIVSLFHWGFVFAIWGGIAAVGLIAYYAAQLPSSDTWAIPDRPPNIRVLAADGQLISNRGKTGGEAVTLRELPAYVPAAVISSEDRRFMSHFGVDPIGLAAVALESFEAGRVTRGASTLTQQVAKNLFLTPDQTLGRKVQEALLALWLEHNYSKEEILELYLNRVFFGHGATGIEAAAQTYFGKSARNLSLGEAAMLAGILPAPSAYNPKSNPEKAGERQRLVLNAMAEEGYITREEAKAAQIDPDQTVRTRVAGSENYVADWVETLMTAYVGDDIKEDVIVSTTIDWDLQKQAEFTVKEAVANEGPNRGFTQGALVAMEPDGTVRAMVGGVDYQKSQYNRAVTARRQPGSTFKPFVYLAAMEKGYTPDTVADDAPFDYNGWSPRNASGKYAGPVTLRNGLAYSLNTIAARLAIDVGPEKVVETAMRMGISSSIEPVPSIALGTAEVSLLELVGAYAPFSNGGQGVIPNVITRIETASGKVLYESVPAGPGQVIAPEILAEMNDMLTTAVQVGTGKGAHLGNWPIAGKTGTSQSGRDALFVGYTARMVTGVWLGNDDDSKTKLSGGNVPVQIWSDFMSKAHEGLVVADLPQGTPSATQLANAPMQPMIDQFGNPVLGPNGEQVYEPVPQEYLQPAAEQPPAYGFPQEPGYGGFPQEQYQQDFIGQQLAQQPTTLAPPIDQGGQLVGPVDQGGQLIGPVNGTPIPPGEIVQAPPVEERRSRKTLVDMIGNMFGG